MASNDEINRIRITATYSSNSRTSLIASGISNKPLGIRVFGSCFQFSSSTNKRTYHKALVILLTYIAYTSFHMGRRPLSIVKNVLNRNCSQLPNSTVTELNLAPQFSENGFSALSNQNGNETDNSCNWAPFDDDATANQLLAVLDSSFLLSYAILMFMSGFVAERVNLRYLISAGSIFSGIGLIAFGFSYSLNIHSMVYFVVIQVASGAAQTTGWPVVVTCISNWFGPAKRGLIYGLWNSHTNLGNILGATIAGFFVEKDWGLSFIVPGCIMIITGLLLFMFLVPHPQDVDLNPESSEKKSIIEQSKVQITDYNHQFEQDYTKKDIVDYQNDKAVSFLTALKIPGVLEYSVCLFFSKLVSYTFLYWLPRYITSSTKNGSEDSAYLSTPFDVGGIFGAILAGYLSDKFNTNGIICNLMFIFAVPSMIAYLKLGSYSNFNNIALQLLVGALVNGPYCLITTAVSADLGTRIKDGRAMATVAAIIDGMGSIGAVIGPLFAGFVSQSDDWKSVFLMLILSDVIASVCLLRLTFNEIKQIFFKQPSSIANIS